MVSLFGKKKTTAEEKEARQSLQQLRGKKVSITELKPITEVFFDAYDKRSYKGVAPLKAKVDGQWFMTNVVLDPLARLPPLGKTGSKWEYVPLSKYELERA